MIGFVGTTTLMQLIIIITKMCTVKVLIGLLKVGTIIESVWVLFIDA